MKRPRLQRRPLRLRVGRWTVTWDRGALHLDQAVDPHCTNCHGAGGTWNTYTSGDVDMDACSCWPPGRCLRLWPFTRHTRGFSDEPPF